MKHLIFAAALLGATATTSLAQGSSWPAPPTAQQSLALKQDIIAKIADFQSNITNNRTAKAEASANELSNLMKKHVFETRCAAEATTGAQKTQLMQHMNSIENYVLVFMRKAVDVRTNSAEMVTAASDFVTNY